jgi:hypothetical protein
MSFARACLSICHDNSVKAIYHILDYRPCNLLIAFSLIALLIEHLVEEEIPLFVIRPQQRNALI